jgi:hypothetical protein
MEKKRHADYAASDVDLLHSPHRLVPLTLAGPPSLNAGPAAARSAADTHELHRKGATDMPKFHWIRIETSALLTAALLSGLLAISSSGCVAAAEYQAASVESAREAGPIDLQDTSTPQLPYLRNRCPAAQVKFDGRCRRAAFFKRFLSTGGSLIGVSGPPASDSDDTGVVVLEAISESSYNQLYILPDHSPLPGPPRDRSYEYRADYPMIFQQAVLTFQDENGYLHVFSESRGPGLTGLAPVSWSHYAKTASGYEMVDADGVHTVVSASGGSGEYCGLAAGGAGWAASTACGVGALVSGAGSAGAIGLLSGALVFAIGTGGTFGIGAPEAALGGLGTGVALGSAWFAGYVGTAAAVVCGPLGDLVTEAVDTLVCNDEPGPEDIEFLHMILAVPVFPNDLGFCPTGMVLYTGEVMQCTDSNSIVDGIETIEVQCKKKTVQGECVYI